MYNNDSCPQAWLRCVAVGVLGGWLSAGGCVSEEWPQPGVPSWAVELEEEWEPEVMDLKVDLNSLHVLLKSSYCISGLNNMDYM